MLQPALSYTSEGATGEAKGGEGSRRKGGDRVSYNGDGWQKVL